MSKNRIPDFRRVGATAEELEQWRKDQKRRGYSDPRQPSYYRLECKECGRRVWGSGLGIGSHRRACKGWSQR